MENTIEIMHHYVIFFFFFKLIFAPVVLTVYSRIVSVRFVIWSTVRCGSEFL